MQRTHAAAVHAPGFCGYGHNRRASRTCWKSFATNSSCDLSSPSPEQWRRCAPMLLTLGVGLGLTIGLFVVDAALGTSRATGGIRLRRQALRGGDSPGHRANRTGARSHASGLLRLAQRFPRGVHSVCRADSGPRAVAEGSAMGAAGSTATSATVSSRTAQREGWPEYRIIEPDPQGQLVPAQPRDEYFPIWYAASKTGFEARFGWDFAADPVLRKAIDECRDTGTFVVSDAIDSARSESSGPWCRRSCPSIDDFQTVQTVADRRTHLAGPAGRPVPGRRSGGTCVGLCRRPAGRRRGALGRIVAGRPSPAPLPCLAHAAARRTPRRRTRQTWMPAGIHHAATLDVRRAPVVAGLHARARTSSPPVKAGDRGPSWRSDWW